VPAPKDHRTSRASPWRWRRERDEREGERRGTGAARLAHGVTSSFGAAGEADSRRRSTPRRRRRARPRASRDRRRDHRAGPAGWSMPQPRRGRQPTVSAPSASVATNRCAHVPSRIRVTPACANPVRAGLRRTAHCSARILVSVDDEEERRAPALAVAPKDSSPVRPGSAPRDEQPARSRAAAPASPWRGAPSPPGGADGVEGQRVGGAGLLAVGLGVAVGGGGRCGDPRSRPARAPRPGGSGPARPRSFPPATPSAVA